MTDYIDLNKPCSKCGSTNIYHRHRNIGDQIDDGFRKFDKATFELIRSSCRICGYRWTSLPLDKEEVEAG